MKTKMIKKSKLHLENGYVMDDKDRLVSLNYGLVAEINDLANHVQAAAYLHDQPDACPAPSLDGFEPEDPFEGIKFVPNTPTMDEAIEHAMKISEEMDQVEQVEKANKFAEKYRETAQFVGNKKVMVCYGNTPSRVHPEMWEVLVKADIPKLGKLLKEVSIQLNRVGL